MNWNLDKFPNISVKFECGKMVDHMVDHILEIPRIVVFGVKCFTILLRLRNNKSRTKTI